MLEGIRANDIIVGAYSTGDGICPMLAAHRAGGRTSFIGFARAWDRFAIRQVRSQKSRRATERELRILTAHLEASLLADDVGSDTGRSGTELAAAIREHRDLVARRTLARRDEGSRDPDRRLERAARPGDSDRRPELEARPGWAWLRVMRRYDDYRRALELLEAGEALERAEPAVEAHT